MTEGPERGDIDSFISMVTKEDWSELIKGMNRAFKPKERKKEKIDEIINELRELVDLPLAEYHIPGILEKLEKFRDEEL